MNIELVDHMGTDDTVANSARVSFAKEASNYTPEQNAKLINYLAKHNHWTPASHCQVSLRVKIPVFLARQWFKHIVGSVKNEVSRRYVDDEPEFYRPAWRSRPDKSLKQGSGAVLEVEGRRVCHNIYGKALDACYDAYEQLLGEGVAPEQARAVLPQSMYTEFIDTGSLVYFARMYKQRTDSHAQSEWRPLMTTLNEIMTKLYPITWKAMT